MWRYSNNKISGTGTVDTAYKILASSALVLFWCGFFLQGPFPVANYTRIIISWPLPLPAQSTRMASSATPLTIRKLSWPIMDLHPRTLGRTSSQESIVSSIVSLLDCLLWQLLWKISLARHTPQSQGKRGLVTMRTTSCSGDQIWSRPIRFEIWIFMHCVILCEHANAQAFVKY